MWPAKNTLLSCIGLIFLLSCQPKKPVDREGFQKEKETRELKRVSQAELMAKGEVLGKSVLLATEERFKSALQSAIMEEGIAGAIEYCNLNASELVRSFEDSLGISIKRVTDKPRNPMDTLSGIEKEIWEAYAFSPENREAQLLEMDEQNLILTKPIFISTGLCLNCHGKVGAAVTKENYALIKSMYPDDLAIDYASGDLRGMWRIIIPKKTVVTQL